MKYVALVMMVKNEEKYAVRSFESVKDWIDTFVIYDTGSTDNTISEVKSWCEINKKKLYLKQGTFVDFSTSRNELLRHANRMAPEPYLLLLDANDEARGDHKVFEQFLNKSPTINGALIKQIWNTKDSQTTYWNIRCISNHKDWKFIGAVHEFAKYESENGQSHLERSPEEFFIYQNRDDDGGKSTHRLQQDYDMLLRAVQKNPDSPRDTFYLARTCDALGKRHEAIVYYLRRLTQGDFFEEIFWSHMGLGGNHRILGNHLIASDHYQRALEISRRVEPLLALCLYYANEKMFFSALLNAKSACEMKFPDQDILFVNRSDYEYKRWHLLGIVSYYCGEYIIGELACRKAIEYANLDVDKTNLNFYLTKKDELAKLNAPTSQP